jgi:hypothetical protein
LPVPLPGRIKRTVWLGFIGIGQIFLPRNIALSCQIFLTGCDASFAIAIKHGIMRSFFPVSLNLFSNGKSAANRRKRAGPRRPRAMIPSQNRGDNCLYGIHF